MSAREETRTTKEICADFSRKGGDPEMVSGTQPQAENARLRGQLSKAIANANYWRERAIFLEAERDHYRDQVRGD